MMLSGWTGLNISPTIGAMPLVNIPNQEAIYIAMGFRLLAKQEREDAAKQDSLAVKEIHLDSAKTYDGYAEKYDRLSKRR